MRRRREMTVRITNNCTDAYPGGPESTEADRYKRLQCLKVQEVLTRFTEVLPLRAPTPPCKHPTVWANAQQVT